MKNKKISAILSTALVVSMIAGCGNTPVASTETNKTSESVATETTATETTTEEEFSYPIAEGGKLSYWCGINSNWGANFATLGDTEFAKALQEQTGVTIEFMHPASGQDTTEFNLMVTEGNFPDLLQRNFVSYSGGPEKAIDDGIIIPLNDIIDQYCPNLKAFLEANPDIDKMVKTDEGTYYTFPFVYETAELGVTQGLYLREDWLNELGLDVPENMDDWHEVLTAFKEKKGAEAPLCVSWSSLNASTFLSAFDIGGRTWHLGEGGKVQYGALMDEYKEFLMTMKQWYDEGLIDMDMASLKNDQVTAKMTNGMAGASYGFAASGMQALIQAGKQVDPNYSLVAAPVPGLTEGDKPTMSPALTLKYTGIGVSISTDCENVELAARLMDYGYSEEGRLLYNYGIEGESYEMVNGVPTYTDTVLKNEDGWTIGQAMSKYALACCNGPFVQEFNYLKQYYSEPNVSVAPEVWNVEGAADHKNPPVTATPEEAEERATIETDLNTYVNEMILKFVLGEESFDNWDNYIKTAKDFGLERALELRQAAVDRYNAR